MKIKQLLTVAALSTMAAVSAGFAEETQANLSESPSGWRPTISIRNEVSSGYFNRGVLWDKNFGNTLSINVGLLDNLTLSLYARIPITDARDYTKFSGIPDGYDEQWNLNLKTRKIKWDKYRDDDYDSLGLSLSYGYTFADIPVIGDLTAKFIYNIQKNADIYSKQKVQFHEKLFYEDDILNYDFHLRYDFDSTQEIKRREEVEQYATLGFSMDSVFLNPNASISINQEADFIIQMGVKYSLPCDFVSDNLTFNNSLDIYYFSKDFFKAERKEYYYQMHDVLEQYGSDLPLPHKKESQQNLKTKLKSDAGFKNLVLHSSLDYAFTQNLRASLYAMFIYKMDDYANNEKGVFQLYENIKSFEILYGVSVGFTF